MKKNVTLLLAAITAAGLLSFLLKSSAPEPQHQPDALRRQASTLSSSPATAGTNSLLAQFSDQSPAYAPTGLLAKLCGKHGPHPKAPALNTDSLKGSDWYGTVMADIKHKSYFIATAGDSANSCNTQQGIVATYRAAGVTINEMQAPDERGKPGELQKKKHHQKKAGWQLQLTVDGLYADNKPAAAINTTAGITTDTSEVSFATAGMTTQYVNTEAGVRQNFIVPNKPAANTGELRVKLHASKSWVVAKANDRELHFAQHNRSGGLDTRLIYKDLNVWDADGRKLAAKMDVGRDNCFDIIVAAAGAKYPVTIDPLATTAATTLSDPATTNNDNFGVSVASAGDVNGDGYSDVIVGAYNTTSNQGMAYVYLGSSTGLSASVSAALSDPAATSNDYFGSNVASAGDVNGDGYSDVMIGAYGTTSNQGKAYVYLGSFTGLFTGAPVTLSDPAAAGNDHFGGSVASAGDVNGDGYSDVIVGAYGTTSNRGKAYVYLGSSTALFTGAPVTLSDPATTSNDYFGSSVASAGDVNGDGYSDVIVGAYGTTSNRGKAYVYLGSSTAMFTGAPVTLSDPAATSNDYFGSNVAAAGDVNGDGYSDVIVGAYGTTSNRGKAYVYLGSSTAMFTGAPVTLSDPAATSNDYFGSNVAAAGDVNGDGYSDVIVSAFGTTSFQGKAYVYLGSSTALFTGAPVTLSDPATTNFDLFGGSVASAGDVNGDGYSDVIVGAYGTTTSRGNAYVYPGSANSVMSSFASSAIGPTSGGAFGVSVAGAGDVNGDGFSDLIIGDYVAGKAYVYYGSATGLGTIPFSTLTGPTPSSDYGRSVAGAGDVNGDGYSDVIVGAYLTTNGNAYVYLGSSTGISTTVATTLAGPSAGSGFGISVATAGDVDGDGYGDVIVGAHTTTNGNAYVYLGASGGLPTTAAATLTGPSSGSRFGRSVATAGDVNGDGYSDVIVGAYLASSAYVYTGAIGGLSATPTALTGYPAASQFGYSVAAAGDVDGDGFGDVIVGTLSNTAGNAYVFSGAATGLNTTAATTLTGPSAGSGFGISVASAGDVNGDGYSDVVVGADNTATGNAYAYLGSSTGLSATAAVTMSGPSAGSEFGYSVASAGDVNGDGFSEIIVGAFNTTNGSEYLYRGYNGITKRNNHLRLYNTDLTSPLSQGNHTATQFGAGLFVRPFTGATKARMVWETEGAGTGFMHNSPITNYAGYTAGQTAYTTIPPAGVELKNLITKTGISTKVRVRLQYLGALLPNGQKFGPWIYPQAYLMGAMASISGPVVTPLPVTLTAFSAKLITDNNVLLSWSVANAKDNRSYVTERSADGSSFSATGKVAATAATEYSLHDYSPLPGKSYYRLRLTAADGSSSYSNVQSVFIGKGGYVHVYPSPAKDYFVIETGDAAVTGILTDMQGRIMMHIGTVQSGAHINIAALAAGIYVLKLSSRYSFKITKE